MSDERQAPGSSKVISQEALGRIEHIKDDILKKIISEAGIIATKREPSSDVAKITSDDVDKAWENVKKSGTLRKLN